MNPSDTGKLVAVYARVSTEHEAQRQETASVHEDD